ncbi:MAG TPA: hypothetical protein VGF98_13055 [Candidatus Tumulicola sp.]
MQQHVLLATWIANHWSDVASVASIVIAFVAAFRPELHALLRPRRVDVLLSDSLFLEIGFNGFGPTLGVIGTLNNEHARSLITKMRIRLKASGANGEFVLTPLFNRERAINSALAGGEEARGKFWLPFLIEADVAIPFDIFFRNDAATAAVTSSGFNLGQAWMSYANAKVQENEQALSDPDPTTMQAKVAGYLTALSNESGSQDFIVTASRELSDAFVWQVQTYEARLEVDVLDCHRAFSRSFQFAISEEQLRQLQENIGVIIAIVCKQLDPNTVPCSAFSKITLED